MFTDSCINIALMYTEYDVLYFHELQKHVSP
jgi:hypothetical protein